MKEFAILSAEDVRKKQEEVKLDMTYNESEVESIVDYVNGCLDKIIQFPAIKEIIIPKRYFNKIY